MISIIIVNFNSEHYLLDCVNSILQQNSLEVEIFVVDNHSSDQSLHLLQQAYANDKRLNIISNEKNLGFSKANNLAVAKARGNYLLFLNPDTQVKPGTLPRMIQIMNENPDAGMAGCLILNIDGTIQSTCLRSIPTPWNSLVRVLHLHKIFKNKLFGGLDLANRSLPNKTTAVEAISGAFMLVRRAALQQIGSLDENYFLYCEDVDWMMRFHQANWKILFVPDVAIIHAKSISSKKTPFAVLWYKHTGMMRFYRKFFREQYSVLLMWLVYLAIWFRFSLLIFIAGCKRMLRMFA